jgi:MSHA biogenesis protein MshG
MATFSYQGRDIQGELVNGRIEAESSAIAANQLRDRGIIPVDITMEKNNRSIFRREDLKEWLLPPVKSDEIVVFCRQAYALLKSGVPLFEALTKIVMTIRSKRLKLTVERLINHVAHGQTLSAALRRYPKIFPPIFANVIDAGETSGQLAEAFHQLATYMILETTTKRRMVKATRYPIFVMTFVLVAILAISFFVVPSFREMYESFDTVLPLPTRIIMAISSFLLAYWKMLLVILLIALLFIFRFKETKQGAFFIDRLKLMVPITGDITKRIILARFARTLTMVMRTGVPIIEGLNLVAQATGNCYIAHYLLQLCHRVKCGIAIPRAAKESGLFTPLVLQMLEVGEQSGQIDNMMEEVAKFYENEIDYDLTQLSDLIEPILLLLVSGLVLVLMLAVFLPLWNMSDFSSL